jgi:hypothetical protein
MRFDASVTAPGQTITLLGQSSAIMQSAGEVTTQNTGTLDMTADLGITESGSNSALQTNSQIHYLVDYVCQKNAYQKMPFPMDLSRLNHKRFFEAIV